MLKSSEHEKSNYKSPDFKDCSEVILLIPRFNFIIKFKNRRPHCEKKGIVNKLQKTDHPYIHGIKALNF